jgi:hypothetical protein
MRQMRSKADSVMAVPEGRHNPLSNRSSATSPPTARALQRFFSDSYRYPQDKLSHTFDASM